MLYVMWVRLLPPVILILTSAFAERTGEISGEIHITKRLTKQRVTLEASGYQRGVAVPLDTSSPDLEQSDLARTAVYLEGDSLPGGPITVEVNQKNRRFDPELIVAPVGSTISFPNLDPIFHNVFSLSKTKSFDLGYYPKNDTRKVTFDKPGVVQVYCHLHPNMSMAVVITPNRLALRPLPGKFLFRGLPDGTYRVVVWHKSAGYFRKTVAVSGGRASVEFDVPVEQTDGREKGTP